MLRIRKNIFTGWKEQTQIQQWYEVTESVALRAKLGEISSEEVAEVNRVLGGEGLDGVTFSLSSKEPALITALSTLPLALMGGLGAGMGLYGKFVLKFNNLWLLGTVVPVAVYQIARGNANRDKVDDAYRYILAKRQATVEHEQNAARFAANPWAQSAECQSLASCMSAKGATLYDVEAALVKDIMEGRL